MSIRFAPSNTSLEPTATSHAFRHEVIDGLIAPSRCLHRHSACRRYGLVLPRVSFPWLWLSLIR